jgi:copper chaperone
MENTMENTTKSETLSVKGMSCEHCVRAVNNALAGIAGVTDVKVSLKDGTASFSRDPAITPIETVVAAITDEGYEVEK